MAFLQFIRPTHYRGAVMYDNTCEWRRVVGPSTDISVGLPYPSGMGLHDPFINAGHCMVPTRIGGMIPLMPMTQRKMGYYVGQKRHYLSQKHLG